MGARQLIDDFVEVARATTVRLNWDSPLAYPEASDEAWFKWASEHGTDCPVCGETHDWRNDHDDDELDSAGVA